MIIKPRIRGFICTTAHPVGCAALTNAQIAWTSDQPPVAGGPRNVLVIGGSGGYGLASRVVAAFAMGARTLCLSFEKEPGDDRTASAGWYNNLAFDRIAAARNLYARSLNADAFADATKAQVSEIVRSDLGRSTCWCTAWRRRSERIRRRVRSTAAPSSRWPGRYTSGR